MSTATPTDSMTHYIGQGDTAPQFQATLTSERTASWTLAGASVKLWIWPENGGAAILAGGSCSIVDPVAHSITYSPIASDTAVAGKHPMRVIVTFADGTKESFPNDGYGTWAVSATPS